MRLNDRLRELHSEVRDRRGQIRHDTVVERLRGELTADELWLYASSDITRRSKTLATKSASSKVVNIKRATQLDMFEGLQPAYVIDSPEGLITKDTDYLTFSEFRQAVKVREDQIEADQAAVAPMNRVLRLLRPLWEQHPTWTYAATKKAWLKAEARRVAA